MALSFRASLVLGLLMLSGCDSKPADGAGNPGGLGGKLSGVASPANRNDPDQLWQSLFAVKADSSSGVQSGDKNKAILTDFWIDVELFRQHFWSKGQRFWTEAPDDPRRYEWLAIASHMRPVFPESIQSWASAKANASCLLVSGQCENVRSDANLSFSWQTDFERYYSEAANSAEVPEETLRFIDYGRFLWSISEMKAAADVSEDSRMLLLDSFVQFSERYAEPGSILDESNHTLLFSRLIGVIFTYNREAFGWEPESAISALEKLISSPNTATAENAQIVIEFINNYPHLWMDERVDAERDPSSLVLAQLQERLVAPSVVASSNQLAVPVYLDSLAMRHELRHLGLQVFDSARSEAAKNAWLSSTISNSPFYLMDLSTALQRFSEFGAWNAGVEISETTATEQASSIDALVDAVGNDGVRDSLKLRLRTEEIWDRMWWTQSVPGRRSSVEDTELMLTTLMQSIDDPQLSNQVVTALSTLVTYRRRYNVSTERLRLFFETVANNSNDTVRSAALGALNQLDAEVQPIELSMPLMDGGEFRLSELRGKIVLVDHWATTCASCIAAMPRIRDVAREYEDAGFVVVSIAYDGTRNRRQIMRIKERLDLVDWVSVNGDGYWESVLTQFNYRGFPQYMLLDRDGVLYAGTGEVDMGRNLEALLEEMLAAEAAGKEAATTN